MTTDNRGPLSPPSTSRPHGHHEDSGSDAQSTQPVENLKSFPLTSLPYELVSEVFTTVVLSLKSSALAGAAHGFTPRADLEFLGMGTGIPLKARQSLALSSISRDLRRIAVSTPSLWVYVSNTMQCEAIELFAARARECLLHVHIHTWAPPSCYSGSCPHLYFSPSIRRLWEVRARWGSVYVKGNLMNILRRTEVQHVATAPLRLLNVQLITIDDADSSTPLTAILHAMPSLRILRMTFIGGPLDVTPARATDGSTTPLSAAIIPLSLHAVTLSRMSIRLCDFETLLKALRESPAWQNFRVGESKIGVVGISESSAVGDDPDAHWQTRSLRLSPALRRLTEECRSEGKIEISIRQRHPRTRTGTDDLDILSAFNFDNAP